MLWSYRFYCRVDITGVDVSIMNISLSYGDASPDYISDLFNSIICDSKVPYNWDMYIIQNCFNCKGDTMGTGNYSKGLKLLEHLMKLFE